MKKFEVVNHEPSFLPEGEWNLVWADEFDGMDLDESKWSYRLNFWGKPFPAYCDKGVTIDGNSHAVFKPVKMEDGRICSAQLQTGANSFDIPRYTYDDKVNACGDNNFWPLGRLPEPKFMHRYGYYEVRCKLQKTPGWWSAFWIQSPSIGTTFDPKWSGVEVDIMEYFGNNKLTSGNFYGGYGVDLKRDARVRYDYTDTDEFHRFGLLWTENEYVFYYDGKETSRTNGPISGVEQFILLTTEVQGYRRGDGTRHEATAEKCLDDSFVVDYVRVFDRVK
ncbi:MAG: glycosyl hydrolase family protein [Ruminococcaceae bacterium]|nr:glycosyl hydrolase family protein [Oscillospiraceae bacterium]